MPTETLRVLVMGAGAIGSVVGGFLAKAGHAVTLVGRTEHMHAVQERGLRITGIWGEHVVQGINAHTGIGSLPAQNYDVIVLTVKSYDTPAAVAAIAPLLNANTLVCAYQNGLGNAETVAEAAGWARTVGVRAIYGARVTCPGEVAVTVIAQPTALGVFTEEAPGTRVAALARAMDDAGLPTVYCADIAPVIWAKVAYNCALNPLSALLNVPYGRLAALPETREIMDAAIDELYLVGTALGVRLEPATSEAYRELFYQRLVPPTAVHFASMREDLRQGRRTEIDALNGAIERYARQLGLACPTHALLTRLIRACEQAHTPPA